MDIAIYLENLVCGFSRTTSTRSGRSYAMLVSLRDTVEALKVKLCLSGVT